MKDDEVTWVLTKNKYSILLVILGSRNRKYLTQKTVFQNYRPKLDLSSLMHFAREWDQFQDIPHLILPLPPYSQGGGGVQEKSIQWLLAQWLNMKLLGRQYHKN